uniref:Transmembrane protein n=1 Tax=Caulobacter sp. (strain K31) TaxID=366602 RepID=B0SZD9_CAUSK
MTDVTQAPQGASGQVEEDKVLPIVVYALYLLGFTNGLTFLVGLIVAYVNRETAGPINASHYTFAIRTFWLSIWWFLIGLALVFVGLALLVLLIGVPIMIVGGTILGAISIWFVVRTILGLTYLLKGEAYPRPRAWLI